MKKDDRLVKTNGYTHQLLSLSTFPNFHESGNIEGMRNLYYGKDAFLVHSGHYIYHVDEDTFHAVKDSNYLMSQPEWLNRINEQLTESTIQSYKQNVIEPKDRELQAEKEALYRKTFDDAGLAAYTTEEICEIASGQAPRKVEGDMTTFNKAGVQVRVYEQKYNEKFHQNMHGLMVMSLATRFEMMQKLVARIDKGLTAVKLSGTDGAGHVCIAARMDGRNLPDTRLTAGEVQELNDLPADKLHAKYVELVAKHNADQLFAPLFNEVKQHATAIPQAQTSTDVVEKDPVIDMAEKMSAVFEKFYSLHEVDELCRVITDPEKTVDDVKATMSDIAQRNRMADEREAAEARISAATFLYPSVTNVALNIHIDGLQMPFRLLNSNDAQMIRGTDMSKLSESDIQDMARDLAITYYDDVLRATPEQLSMIANADTKNLTKSDARTYADFDNAVSNRFPDGATLQIPDLINDDIWGYIMFDTFRDESFISTPIGEEPVYTETLKSEVRVPADELHRLMASADVYNNTVYEDFIQSLPNAEDYEVPVTEMLHKYPDLNGAQLEVPEALVSKHIYIEGQPLDAVVSIMLQKNDISDEQLKAVLTDPAAYEAFVTEIMDNRSDELKFIKNPEFMYFYEPGVLGHARVDRMRGVTFSGETLSRASQDRIMDFALNRNINATNGRSVFFLMPGAESKLTLYLDTMKNQLHKVYSQPDWQGNTIYAEGPNRVSEEDVKSMQDITGRITDAQIVGSTNPIVRCKIDGVQQSGQKLTRAEISTMVHFMDKPEEFKSFALSIAAKHFATELYESIEQKQNKGMGR